MRGCPAVSQKIDWGLRGGFFFSGAESRMRHFKNYFISEKKMKVVLKVV
jgi:hypothetical protein